VIVEREQLVIGLVTPEETDDMNTTREIRLSWHRTPPTRRREILLPHNGHSRDIRPTRL